jgi:hypothetical protein
MDDAGIVRSNAGQKKGEQADSGRDQHDDNQAVNLSAGDTHE